jgi:inosine/guanosine/xanthosine phosphorylase family protein
MRRDGSPSEKTRGFNMNAVLLEQSYEAIRRGIGDAPPRCVVVLGSGWSQAVANADCLGAMPFADIPLLGATAIAGHAGRLVRVRRQGSEALVFCGRRHWYEGAGWEPVALPVFTALRMRAPFLLLTNAAGGIHPELAPGSAMVVADHLNLMGVSPLVGPHDPMWGPRFPDMTGAYDEHLRGTLAACLSDVGQHFRHGVYAAVSGPSYETPAEVRALRLLNADAVGMSTVPEAILARASGLRVAALSLISNRAAGLAESSLSHDEVLQAATGAAARLWKAVSLFLERLPDRPDAVSP